MIESKRFKQAWKEAESWNMEACLSYLKTISQTVEMFELLESGSKLHDIFIRYICASLAIDWRERERERETPLARA